MFHLGDEFSLKGSDEQLGSTAQNQSGEDPETLDQAARDSSAEAAYENGMMLPGDL